LNKQIRFHAASGKELTLMAIHDGRLDLILRGVARSRKRTTAWRSGLVLLMALILAIPADGAPTLTYKTGLLTWLRADDLDGDGDTADNPANGTAVSQWKDSHTSGNHATNYTAGSQPLYRPTGGPVNMPMVEFDGTNDFMELPPLTYTAWTMFIVGRMPAGPTTTALAFGDYGTAVTHFPNLLMYRVAGTPLTFRPSMRDGVNKTIYAQDTNGWTKYAIRSAWVNDKTMTYQVTDGVSTYTGAGTRDATFSATSLGGYHVPMIGALPPSPGSSFANLQLCELLLYNSTLTTGQCAEVEGYLKDKYYPLPTIANRPATNVTATSAFLNGYLSSSSAVPDTVSVYWGQTDGGAPTSGLWQATNSWAQGAWTAGTYPTYQVSSLTENKFYYYRYYATNAIGHAWASTSEKFLAGNVWVTAPDASAMEPPPDGAVTNAGVLTIQRDPGATNDAVTIYYAWAGTATNGVDYTPSPAGTNVVLPAGVAETNITITPLQDPQWTADKPSKTAWLTLLTGAYGVGTPASTSVTIERYPVTAGANATTGAGSWTNGAIWSLGRRPVPGDDVTVKHAVLLPRSTDYLSSFTITNATLTFTNWATALHAVTVIVQSNGTLSLPAAFTTSQMSNRVWVVCSNLTIAAGGMILADARGYLTENGPGRGYYNGVHWGCGGGGYGGKGGFGQWGSGGATNGSMNEPLTPGSGGGGIDASANAGGNGGGAVRIEADGLVTVNGTVTANGANAVRPGNMGGGGGSGGGIYITCASFEGSASGILRANGGNGIMGNGAGGGGGGGGRIAVWMGVAQDYRTRYLNGETVKQVTRTNVVQSFSGTVSVTNGMHSFGSDSDQAPGTAFFFTSPPGRTVFIFR
jgi:hypothetical protein